MRVVYIRVYECVNKLGILTRETNSLFLNPEVWENCTNLWKDYNYCVQPVGTITTYTGYPGYTPTAPFEETPATPIPFIDPSTDYTTNITVIPLANGTRLDCTEYVLLSLLAFILGPV